MEAGNILIAPFAGYESSRHLACLRCSMVQVPVYLRRPIQRGGVLRLDFSGSDTKKYAVCKMAS
jgi:hypothetical protein